MRAGQYKYNYGDIRRCTGCGRNLPWMKDHFNVSTRRKNGEPTLNSKCRDCVKAYRFAYDRNRSVRLAGREPVTCDCCGVRLRAGLGRDAANWDHNHDSGEFRGWLCMHCNQALGLAGDNPKILDALAAYLRSRGYGQKRPLIR